MAVTHRSARQFEEAMTCSDFAPCPQDGHWEIPTDSDICTEIETLALLFGFVRALRPQLVVETGCNVGKATKTILSALESNGSGRVVTCDVEGNHVHKVGELASRYPGKLSIDLMTGLALVQLYPQADLYWIDSSEESRMLEVEYLRANGKAGAIILAHDTSCYGALNELVRSFPRSVLLPGPRGLGVITL